MADDRPAGVPRGTGRRLAAVAIAALWSGLCSGVAPAAPVPHVGCASDGQQGPQRAPRGAARAVPGPDGGRLADYVMADGTRTLAPRGWRCAGRYGSNGSVLFVAPDAATLRALLAGRGTTGPAIVRELSFGGTSGRFEVARIAALLFPAAAAFVAEVEAEDVADPFPRGLPRGDRITRLAPLAVLFTTPPGGRGVGTGFALAPGPLPSDGLAVMEAGPEHDLHMMTARLPAAMRPLVAPIIADMRASLRVPAGR